MINQFVRYFKGYLRIRISGNSVERFLNACSHKGIILWDLSSNNSCYEVNIKLSDFKKLKPVIRKTRTKTYIVNRTGFPFFIKKYQNRKLFFTGLILCLFIISYLSTFIWNIKVTGNQTYTTETITEFLNSIHIKRGMKTGDVRCKYIVSELRKQFDDIIWVSASIDGSDLVIQIKENDDSLEISETETIKSDPYDIVSTTDCTITRIVIRNGLTNIKEGDIVRKGTILVSGNIPVLNDAKEIIGYQQVISDAEIHGKTSLYYKNDLEILYNDKLPEDVQKKEYFIQIGDYRLGFGSIRNKYNSFTEYSSQKNIAGIIVGIRSVRPYKSIKKKYKINQIREILSSDFQYYCKELEKKGVVILENNVKIYTWSDKATAKGTLTIEMPVGQLKKSEIIEVGEPIDGNDGNNN